MAYETTGYTDASLKSVAFITGLTGQGAPIAAGLAGRVTLAAGLGPAVQVEARRAALQALSPLPQVDVTRPTAQAVFVTRTPAPATRGVASLTNHGVGVAKVTL